MLFALFMLKKFVLELAGSPRVVLRHFGKGSAEDRHKQRWGKRTTHQTFVRVEKQHKRPSRLGAFIVVFHVLLHFLNGRYMKPFAS